MYYSGMPQERGFWWLFMGVRYKISGKGSSVYEGNDPVKRFEARLDKFFSNPAGDRIAANLDKNKTHGISRESRIMTDASRQFVNEHSADILSKYPNSSTSDVSSQELGKTIKKLNPLVAAELLISMSEESFVHLSNGEFLSKLSAMDHNIASALLYEIRLTEKSSAVTKIGGNPFALADPKLLNETSLRFFERLGAEAASELFYAIRKTDNAGALLNESVMNESIVKLARENVRLAGELFVAIGTTNMPERLTSEKFISHLRSMGAEVAVDYVSALWLMPRNASRLVSDSMARKIIDRKIDVWTDVVRNPSSEVRRSEPLVLIANTESEGHDRGAKLAFQYFMQNGFNVMYAGKATTPQAITSMAEKYKAGAIGISLPGDQYGNVAKELVSKMKAVGMGNVPIFGGGIVSKGTIEHLSRNGIRFLTDKDSITRIISSVKLDGINPKKLSYGNFLALSSTYFSPTTQEYAYVSGDHAAITLPYLFNGAVSYSASASRNTDLRFQGMMFALKSGLARMNSQNGFRLTMTSSISENFVKKSFSMHNTALHNALQSSLRIAMAANQHTHSAKVLPISSQSISKTNFSRINARMPNKSIVLQSKASDKAFVLHFPVKFILSNARISGTAFSSQIPIPISAKTTPTIVTNRDIPANKVQVHSTLQKTFFSQHNHTLLQTSSRNVLISQIFTSPVQMTRPQFQEMVMQMLPNVSGNASSTNITSEFKIKPMQAAPHKIKYSNALKPSFQTLTEKTSTPLDRDHSPCLVLYSEKHPPAEITPPGQIRLQYQILGITLTGKTTVAIPAALRYAYQAAVQQFSNTAQNIEITPQAQAFYSAYGLGVQPASQAAALSLASQQPTLARLQQSPQSVNLQAPLLANTIPTSGSLSQPYQLQSASTLTNTNAVNQTSNGQAAFFQRFSYDYPYTQTGINKPRFRFLQTKITIEIPTLSFSKTNSPVPSTLHHHVPITVKEKMGRNRYSVSDTAISTAKLQKFFRPIGLPHAIATTVTKRFEDFHIENEEQPRKQPAVALRSKHISDPHTDAVAIDNASNLKDSRASNPTVVVSNAAVDSHRRERPAYRHVLPFQFNEKRKGDVIALTSVASNTHAILFVIACFGIASLLSVQFFSAHHFSAALLLTFFIKIM